MSYQWAKRTLEPCYDVVYSLRHLVEKYAITYYEPFNMDEPLLDRIFVGFDDDIDDPPSRLVINFRSLIWMLSNNNHRISASDVHQFLADTIFDQIDKLIGGNQLLHLLQSGSWFELVGDKAISQRIGECLDYTISNPNFVFRPCIKPIPKILNRHLFEYEIKSSTKKTSIRTSKVLERKALMYSFGVTWSKKMNKSESKSQVNAAILAELDQIFSFAAFLRLANNQELKTLMSIVKTNHEKCRLESLVNKFCPIDLPTSIRDMIKLLKDVKSHESVCELMRNILFFVFPKKLFGSCGNRVKMFNSMKLIVITGLNVQLQARNLIRNIDLKSVPWLSSIPDGMKKKTLEEFAMWIWNYLVSCLRCYFYVTETKFDKSKLHFYRKETWSRICKLEIDRQKEANVLNLLTNVSQQMYCNTGFRSSGARFVPKTDSLRMINRLFLPLHSGEDCTRDLKGLRSLLQLLKNDQKFVLNHNKFPHVIREIKENQQKDSESKLYFIRADIKHCYPSIKHDVLINIIESRMEEIFGTLPSSITIQLFNFLCIKSFRIKRKPEFVVKNPHVPLNALIIKNTVSIPGESFQLRNPLEKIKIYIDDAVIKFSREMYRMNQGIRQGALLSADLCTLYMESFVNESFKSLQLDEDHLLLEADDLIILTESLERAQACLKILRQGSEKFNMVLNLDKLRINFLDSTLKEHNISNEVVFFSYSFSTFTQELTADYTSFVDKDIKYSFACNPFVSFEKTRKRLIRQLSFTPELMDRRINSREVLLRNLFERLHLQAFRFASFVLTLKEHRIAFDPSEIYNFIVGLIQKVLKLNRLWSRQTFTELSEEEIALTCICSVRQVWMERMKSRKSEIDQMDQMMDYLFSKSSARNHLQERLTIFQKCSLKYPFSRIILS